MVNYSTDVLKDIWVAISDNKDYVLQNKGTGSILVKASDIMPTDAVGAIEVQGKKWITSKELYGKVWCSAAIGTGGAGAWIVRGSAHTTADIASAAFTTVGVTAGTAIDVTGNTGSMQINTDVTAVSGTTPRLINRLQGSFDGINFVNIYDVGVMTTSTAKNNDTPVIPVEFRSIRHTMDCRGTSPSFTRSVNRVMRPMEVAKRQRRLLDRVVGLTTTTASTEWLYVGGCTNAQIMSTAMAGQTVAAVVKVQLCQGDPAIAANWYDVPSAPTLTTSASAPVVTAPFVIGNAKFARLVPTTAGTGIVADTYELALTAWE